MNIQVIESGSRSPTESKDYRRTTLFGWALALVGALFGCFVATVALTVDGPKMHPVPILIAMIGPALLIFIGLLIIRRAKLALWLMYLLTADFAYSLSIQVGHAFKTKRRDDIYSFFFNAFVLMICLSVVMYIHHRRSLFTGFWGSLGTNTSPDRTTHGDGN